MTAEVALLNKSAVALAADSAVTVGDVLKIYNTVNKLFALSKYEPVGIMFYNSLNLMDIPFETVIKVFRKQLADRTKPTLVDYAVDFIRFLEDPGHLFGPEIQKRYLREAPKKYFSRIRQEIEWQLGMQIRWHEKLPFPLDFVEGTIKYYHSLWDSADFLPGWNDYKFNELIWEYEDAIDFAADVVFGPQSFSHEARNLLREIAASLFTKNKANDWNYTGIVIAGFGVDDIFPSIVAFRVEGMVDNNLKLFRTDSQSIDFDNPAIWLSFAQREMVEAFMNGIDPDLKLSLQTSTLKLFWDYTALVVDQIQGLTNDEKQELTRQLREAGKTPIMEFLNEIDDRINRRHTWPVEDALAVLPKDELAEMAETLVSLTSFKRRVTLGQETVGGPVDVAVISKGDGFVWIKRKAYFDATQNLGYSKNYLRL